MRDPHLPAGLLQERIDGGSRFQRDLLIALRRRDVLTADFFGIVIEITGQRDGSGVPQRDEQDLMPGRMSGVCEMTTEPSPKTS